MPPPRLRTQPHAPRDRSPDQPRRPGGRTMTAIRPDIVGLPETVPARTVNEFVYCPRLFHLEWVQGRFALNDDVEEGLYVHGVVDEPGGYLPAGDDDDPERFAGRVSRSLWLTSTDLGISARLDVAEVGAGGTVVPVDYKKGSPDKRRGRPGRATRCNHSSRHFCSETPDTASQEPRSGT